MMVCFTGSVLKWVFLTGLKMHLPPILSSHKNLLSFELNILVLEQASHTASSRRQCLTCLCSTVALIVAPGISDSDPKAIAFDGKEKAVCRNCGGSGAVICKKINRLMFIARSYCLVHKTFICSLFR